MPSLPRRHALTLATAAVCGLTVAASPASAALPKKGATYFGTVGDKTVTVKISRTSPLKGRYTFDCGPNGGPLGDFIKLTIRRDGRFSGRDGGGVVDTISSLKGRFTSSSRATATLKLGICGGEGGKVTLKRQS